MQAATPTSGSADAAGWTLTFRDGQRRIDMVLAYPDESEIGPDAIKRQTYRKTFENNLFKQGLQLEVEPSAVGEPEQKGRFLYHLTNNRQTDMVQVLSCN